MIAMQAIEDSMRRESAALQKLESQLASLQYALHPLSNMPCPSLLTYSAETSVIHVAYAFIRVSADDLAAGLPE